ncbi:MAG: zinc-dependent metalloprotease [Bacteroidota bacterium]|nr:zinc-dependent metalloprotease [Bacteroidota bacterium]
MKYTIIILMFCLVGSLNAQSNFCGNSAIEQHIRQKDSLRFEGFQHNFKANIQHFRAKQTAPFHLPNRIVPIYDYTPGASSMMVGGSTCAPTKFIIPVVVHVVHNNGTENISDAQINHQIEELNKHFSNYYLASAPAVNTGIQFILANKDIQNNTISGITRHQSYLYQHKKIKQTDSLMQLGIQDLPMTHYLHIWVVGSILDADGNNLGVKAYATRPGSKFNGSEGVVINYDWMGEYAAYSSIVDANSRANALTHEIGHYLGLYHPFEGGCAGLDASDCAKKGDLCCDVPAVSGQNQNCSYINSCEETYNNDAPDQKQNYMDYSMPDCKNSFTADQTSIMHITLQSYRQALWQPTHINAMTSTHCVLSANFTGDKNFMCTDPINLENSIFTAYEQSNVAYQWTVWRNGTIDNSLTSTTHTLSISNTTAGVYDIKLSVNSGNSIEEYTIVKALEVSACGNKIADHRANWYFGQYAGLGFYEGNRTFRDLGPYNTPIPSNIDVEEGSMALSDSSTGDLLFYGAAAYGTNRFEVYGNNYTMLKGQEYYLAPAPSQYENNPVIGYSSNVQSCVSLKLPGIQNEYILFTSSGGKTAYHSLTNKPQSGYVYSIIKIDVSNRSNDSVSYVHNINLKDNSGNFIDGGDGIAAVRHCNGNDYWVLIKGKLDTLYKFKVSNNRQIIYEGFSLIEETDVHVQIVFSPNGKYINIGRYLYSFNRQNGQVKILHKDLTLNALGKTNGVNGAVFSNNSKLLYRSYIEKISQSEFYTPIFQYDIESGESNMGRKNINTGNKLIRYMQNGPDKKIYLTAPDLNFLSIINNPDAIVSNNLNNIDFIEEGPTLSENGIGGICQVDLPNFPNTSLVEKEALSFIAIQKNCNEVEFISNQTCGGYHIWEFGNGDTSHREQPSYTYTISGTYTVTLTVGDSVFSKEIHIGLPKSDYRIVGDSVSCDGDKVFIYTSKAGSDMEYDWSCVNCSASQANYNTFDVNMSGNGKIKLTINDNKTGCQFKDSLNFQFLNAIENNVVSVGGTCTNIEFIGSTPTGGDGNFQYLWHIRENGSPWQILYSETSKDLINSISPSLKEYMRGVKSLSCIVYSNIIQTADLDKLNVIFKSYSGRDTCSSIIRGNNLNINFTNITYQWQKSLDNSTWENISWATQKDLNYFVNDEIKTYYRRKAISGSCEYISNVIENTSVSLSKPLEQSTACSENTFPIYLKYEFNNESNLTLEKRFEKKSISGDWEPFNVISNIGNSGFSLNKTNTYLISGSMFDLVVGDSLRLKISYHCSRFESFYTNAIKIQSTEDIKILTQPINKSVNGGDRGIFHIVVNDPENSTFKWQTSNSSSGPWEDIPNSNNDTLFVSTGNCTETIIYYRAIVEHPCETLTSNIVSLTITPVLTPTFDYWMKNTQLDVGREEDNVSQNFASSQDIWIRHHQDGIKQHQDLNTQKDVNYVYVTIRNKGKNPTQSAKLYTYWTWGATNESWDLNWTKNPQNVVYVDNGTFTIAYPMGGEINTIGINIPEIPANSTVDIAIPWSDFPKFGWYNLNTQTWEKQRINICLLARIETCDIAPYGMTNTERTDVFYNIKYNNNIVSRNTYTLPLNPNIMKDGDKNKDVKRMAINPNIIDGGTIVVRNNDEEAHTSSICIKTQNALYFDKAETYIEIGDGLKAVMAWSPLVSYSGLTHVIDNIYQVTSSNACFENVVFPAHFQDMVLPLFAYTDINNRFPDGASFNTSIQQKDSLGYVMGECIFTLTDNLFVNPEPTYIEKDTTFELCDNGVSPTTVVYSVNPALPYVMYDENADAMVATSGNDFELGDGEYTLIAIDSNTFTHYITDIHVHLNEETIVNSQELYPIECESEYYGFGVPYESIRIYNQYNQLVDSVSYNFYELYPITNQYRMEYNNTATCQLEKTTLKLDDMIMSPPSGPSTYLFAKYDRTEDSCAFVKLNNLTCNGDSINFGQTIEIYSMDPQYLFTATVEEYSSLTKGFKFCPPLWNTDEAHIHDWHQMIYKVGVCNYCRIDFKADSTVHFPKVLSINDLNINPHVSIYPNPSNSQFNLQIKFPNQTHFTIQITDNMGRLIFNEIKSINNNGEIPLSLENYSNGIYFIKIPELNFDGKVVLIKE